MWSTTRPRRRSWTPRPTMSAFHASVSPAASPVINNTNTHARTHNAHITAHAHTTAHAARRSGDGDVPDAGGADQVPPASPDRRRSRSRGGRGCCSRGDPARGLGYVGRGGGRRSAAAAAAVPRDHALHHAHSQDRRNPRALARLVEVHNSIAIKRALRAATDGVVCVACVAVSCAMLRVWACA